MFNWIEVCNKGITYYRVEEDYARFPTEKFIGPMYVHGLMWPLLF
jgi:hypothetical protein